MLNRKYLACLLLCVPFALLAQTASGGDLPHVAITGFENRTNDEVFDIPAKTATDSLVLTLRLLGMYEVLERDALVDVPTDATDAALGDWCDANGYDYFIYGTIALGQGGSQKYKLSVFDRTKRKTVINETAKGESVLDVFSASDQLAGSVIDSVTGRHIGFGSINFLTISSIEGCQVFLDGIKAAETLDPIDRVVAGTHKIVVKQKTGFSSVTILEQEVEIAEGQSVRVDVVVPTDAGQAEQTWVALESNKKRKSSVCSAIAAPETIKGVEYLTQSVTGRLILPGSSAGIVMKPSRTLLERLKAANGLAFKIQGDRQSYYVRVETSDVTDGNFYQLWFYTNKSERDILVPYELLKQGDWGRKRPFVKDHITGISIAPASSPAQHAPAPISFYFKVYGLRPE